MDVKITVIEITDGMTAETGMMTDTMTAETGVMTDAVTTTIVVGNI